MSHAVPRGKRRVPVGGGGKRRGGFDRSVCFDGIYANSRMTHAAASMVGLPVKVQVKNGSVYDGVFKTFSPKMDICLEQAHRLDSGHQQSHHSNSNIPAKDCLLDKVIFNLKDIVMIDAANVDMEGVNKDGFVDSSISGTKSNGTAASQEKELTPWDSGPGVGDDLESLEESTQSNGWDVHKMFDINQKKFNIKSSYDPNLSQYTVPLVPENTAEYRKREEHAQRIAREIENSDNYQKNLALENGADEVDEEMAFSAVHRSEGGDNTSSGPAGKYVPPPLRRNGPQGRPMRPSTNQNAGNMQNSSSQSVASPIQATPSNTTESVHQNVNSTTEQPAESKSQESTNEESNLEGKPSDSNATPLQLTTSRPVRPPQSSATVSIIDAPVVMDTPTNKVQPDPSAATSNKSEPPRKASTGKIKDRDATLKELKDFGINFKLNKDSDTKKDSQPPMSPKNPQTSPQVQQSEKQSSPVTNNTYNNPPPQQTTPTQQQTHHITTQSPHITTSTQPPHITSPSQQPPHPVTTQHPPHHLPTSNQPPPPHLPLSSPHQPPHITTPSTPSSHHITTPLHHHPQFPPTHPQSVSNPHPHISGPRQPLMTAPQSSSTTHPNVQGQIQGQQTVSVGNYPVSVQTSLTTTTQSSSMHHQPQNSQAGVYQTNAPTQQPHAVLPPQHHMSHPMVQSSQHQHQQTISQQVSSGGPMLHTQKHPLTVASPQQQTGGVTSSPHPQNTPPNSNTNIAGTATTPLGHTPTPPHHLQPGIIQQAPRQPSPPGAGVVVQPAHPQMTQQPPRHMLHQIGAQQQQQQSQATAVNQQPQAPPPSQQVQQQVLPPTQQMEQGDKKEDEDSVSKKSMLNPNAKEFVLNPNAKEFVPSRPAVSAPSQGATPPRPATQSPVMTGHSGQQVHMGQFYHPSVYIQPLVPAQAPRMSTKQRVPPRPDLQAAMTGQPLVAGPAAMAQPQYVQYIQTNQPGAYPQMLVGQRMLTPVTQAQQHLPQQPSQPPAGNQPPTGTQGQTAPDGSGYMGGHGHPQPQQQQPGHATVYVSSQPGLMNHPTHAAPHHQATPPHSQTPHAGSHPSPSPIHQHQQQASASGTPQPYNSYPGMGGNGNQPPPSLQPSPHTPTSPQYTGGYSAGAYMAGGVHPGGMPPNQGGGVPPQQQQQQQPPPPPTAVPPPQQAQGPQAGHTQMQQYPHTQHSTQVTHAHHQQHTHMPHASIMMVQGPPTQIPQAQYPTVGHPHLQGTITASGQQQVQQTQQQQQVMNHQTAGSGVHPQYIQMGSQMAYPQPQ